MGWVHAGAQPPTDRSSPRVVGTPVVLATAAHSPRASVHRAHSVARARQRARLAFTQGGRLASRAVRIGDRVEQGQVLARLEAGGHHNAVRAAGAQAAELDAAHTQLERDRERARRLSAEGVRTQAQLEAVETGFERLGAQRAAVQAQLRESRRRRTEAVLRAPFSGVVTDVLVEPGELIAAGQPVLRLVAPDSGLEVHLLVPGDVVRGLDVGDGVALVAVGAEAGDPLSTAEVEGRIAAVAHDAAGATRLHPVRVELDATPVFVDGVGIEAHLALEGRTQTTVPLAAVLDPSGQRAFVWKSVDGRAERAWVRLGRLEGDAVEIRQGIEPGDQVVVAGHARLLEGDLLAPGDAS